MQPRLPNWVVDDSPAIIERRAGGNEGNGEREGGRAREQTRTYIA